MDAPHPAKNSALRVSKVSKAIKKPPASAPRPVAKVYNADPSDFRRVVQELTGTASTPSPPLPSQPPTTISRFKQFAPPPLRPTFHSLPPVLPMLSPHVLAPLPDLTPGDNAWANPGSDGFGLLGRPMDSRLAPSPRFPWIPAAIWSPRVLPSPQPPPSPVPAVLSPLLPSPSFLPPLSPTFFSSSYFPSPLASPNIHNTLALNAAAQPQGFSQDFTLQGWGGSRVL